MADPPAAGDRGRSRVRLVALSIALLALIEVAYFLEYTGLPFLDGPIFDSVVYLEQARSLHEGRFGDPTLLAFSPLYGWFLAALGRSSHAAVLVQLVLHAVTIGLVFRIVDRRSGRPAAIVAAVLWTGYGVLLFYATKVLSETLAIFLLVAATAVWQGEGFRLGRARFALAAGALLGATVLARASLIFILPFFVLAAVVAWSRDDASLRARVARASWLAAGVAIVLVGNGTWNWAHTGHFVPVIFASRTVQTTTQTAWDGSLAAFAGEGGRGANAWDVVDQAEERLAGRGGAAVPRVDVAGAIAGAPPKLWRLLADTETSFDYGYYGERTEMDALALTPVSFGALALLAAVGAAVLVRRQGWRALVPFVPVVLGVVALVVLYHPSTRYRLPIVVPFVHLGGIAFAAALGISEKRKRAWAVAALGLVVLGFAVRLWTRPLTAPAAWHLRVAQSALAAGDVGQARARFELARRTAPDDPTVQRRIEQMGGARR